MLPLQLLQPTSLSSLVALLAEDPSVNTKEHTPFLAFIPAVSTWAERKIRVEEQQLMRIGRAKARAIHTQPAN